MKKIISIIVLFFIISLPLYSAEKVVYLDVEKIMQESSPGKSIISQLKKKTLIIVHKDFLLRQKINVETLMLQKCEHHIPIEASSVALNFIKKNLYEN